MSKKTRYKEDVSIGCVPKLVLSRLFERFSSGLFRNFGAYQEYSAKFLNKPGEQAKKRPKANIGTHPNARWLSENI